MKQSTDQGTQTEGSPRQFSVVAVVKKAAAATATVLMKEIIESLLRR